MNAADWFPYRCNRLKPKVRIICLPHAGGGASIFRHWHYFFPADIEIVPVQLPGRENRFSDPYITTLNSLLNPLEEALSCLEPLPMIFFGHSLGALIAYELVKRRKYNTVSLFVSACAAPPITDFTRTEKLANNDFIAHVASYGVMPDTLLNNKEMMDLILPRLRADFQLFETCCDLPAEPLDVPIHAFGGIQDKLVTLQQLQQWQSCTKASFSSFLFKGGHFYYQEQSETVCQKLLNHIHSKMLF